MVIADYGRHTGIVISQGPKYTTCVLMESGQLHTTRISHAEYEERAFQVLDYPLERAIQAYLNHPGGISPAARQALEDKSMAALFN